jgi:histidine triad (HIT) family protein
MAAQDDCIFCKIVAGDIPAFKLYEDDTVLSFMDINPFNDGHCLVIPKDHHENLFAMPDAALQAVAVAVRKVAAAVNTALTPDGINIVQANGPAAGQSVYHFHFHVFPRRNDDDAKLNWGLTPGDMDHIAGVAERIKAAM